MRLLISLVLALPLLTGCIGSDPGVLAVLVADERPGAGRVLDTAALRDRVSQVCDGCRVEVHNAGGDAATQVGQLTKALKDEVGGVVIEAIDPDALASALDSAGDVPVVSVGVPLTAADQHVGLSMPLRTEDWYADLAGARALVTGNVETFQHVPSNALSVVAADVVVHGMAGEELLAPTEVDGVPAWVFDPADVTLDNMTTVLVASGLLTLDEICADRERRCEELGLL